MWVKEDPRAHSRDLFISQVHLHELIRSICAINKTWIWSPEVETAFSISSTDRSSLSSEIFQHLYGQVSFHRGDAFVPHFFEQGRNLRKTIITVEREIVVPRASQSRLFDSGSSIGNCRNASRIAEVVQRTPPFFSGIQAWVFTRCCVVPAKSSSSRTYAEQPRLWEIFSVAIRPTLRILELCEIPGRSNNSNR
jgi:hypothetical protein